jgi:manganese-dependent inorganic pyrophosphatase
MAKIYVIGHVNPDTDSIASALGYAWLLNSQSEAEVVPARAGPLNPQTVWVLNRLGLEPPELLSDASPRFESVARRLDSVTPERPLSEAWAIANRTGSVAPVVEPDGTPYGLITGLSLFRSLSELIGTRPEQQQMRVAEVFDIPCRDAADTGVLKFLASMRIRDALPRILREERNDFWVIDEEGRYVGICRQPDLLNPPRLQLVLVDHNEVGQSIASLDEADLLEVLDHHRLSNPPTRLPIRFRVDPVGSTSTLVSERIEDAGLRAPPDLAGLMLAGLYSDTLMLSSPTTTDRDRTAAARLGRWAFVGGAPLEGEDSETFGSALLEAGTGLATRAPESIVTSDLKIYDTAGAHFGIAQVEVASLLEVSDHLEALRSALDTLREQQGLDFAILMVTDIVGGASRIILRGAPPVMDELPYKRLADGSLEANGVVSRKKQLLPSVLALLEG